MALRILVVEDNLITREMLKDIFDILGHQVVAEADDMSGTLSAYQQHKPDLVTVDLSLPKEDGLAILRALRQAHADAKIVVISGNSQQRIRDEVLQAGALDLLGKPIELDVLKRCLEAVSAHGNNPPGPEDHPPVR